MRARTTNLCVWIGLLITALAGGCGSGGNNGNGGGEEIWTGGFSGTGVAAFVCLDGWDSYYEEVGALTLWVPSPGLAQIVQGISLEQFDGTFSNVEVGIEASGLGCAPPPSVFSNEVTTDVTAEAGFGGNIIEVSSSQVLMPARWVYGPGSEDRLDSQLLSLDVTDFGEDSASGTWRAFGGPDASAAIVVSGTFGLTRIHVTPDPVVVKVELTSEGLLGFLAPGTPVQLTATATMSDETTQPCTAPVYQFSNPVGGSINVVQSIDATGLMTIGTDQGAARIWVECDGVPSNLKLVSCTG